MNDVPPDSRRGRLSIVVAAVSLILLTGVMGTLSLAVDTAGLFWGLLLASCAAALIALGIGIRARAAAEAKAGIACALILLVIQTGMLLLRWMVRLFE